MPWIGCGTHDGPSNWARSSSRVSLNASSGIGRPSLNRSGSRISKRLLSIIQAPPAEFDERDSHLAQQFQARLRDDISVVSVAVHPAPAHEGGERPCACVLIENLDL